MMNNQMNNRGMATIESIALITVFTVLVTYSIGMFVVIHTGILNSIAARTYAWETFAHRTNVNFFRDNRALEASRETTLFLGYRSHSIISEESPQDTASPNFHATERYIASLASDDLQNRDQNVHARLTTISKRERTGVNPVWIKTAYGICLTAACGD